MNEIFDDFCYTCTTEGVFKSIGRKEYYFYKYGTYIFIFLCLPVFIFTLFWDTSFLGDTIAADFLKIIVSLAITFILFLLFLNWYFPRLAKILKTNYHRNHQTLQSKIRQKNSLICKIFYHCFKNDDYHVYLNSILTDNKKNFKKKHKLNRKKNEMLIKCNNHNLQELDKQRSSDSNEKSNIFFGEHLFNSITMFLFGGLTLHEMFENNNVLHLRHLIVSVIYFLIICVAFKVLLAINEIFNQHILNAYLNDRISKIKQFNNFLLDNMYKQL